MDTFYVKICCVWKVFRVYLDLDLGLFCTSALVFSTATATATATLASATATATLASATATASGIFHCLKRACLYL